MNKHVSVFKKLCPYSWETALLRRLIRILFLACAVLRAGWQEYNMRAQVSAVKAAAVVQHSLASFLEFDLTVKNFCIVIDFVGVYLSTW